MSSLFFNPVLHPPLGTTTVFPAGMRALRFHALMEVSGETIPPHERFTVLLWWSVNGRGAWKPSPFREITGTIEHLETGLKLLDTLEKRQDLFVLDFCEPSDARAEPMQFCLKYRFSDGPWLWAGSRIGLVDGRIIFQTPSAFSLLEFKDIFRSSSEKWKSRVVGQTAEARIWDVAADVSEPLLCTVGEQILDLGRPVNMERWMSLVKIATPWMGPLHGSGNFSISKDALLLLFQRKDGQNVIVLPVSGVYPTGGSSYLTSDDDNEGHILIKRLNDDEPTGADGEFRVNRVIVAVGGSTQGVVDAAMGYLKQLVTGDGKTEVVTGGSITEMYKKTQPEVASHTSSWDRGASFCTWNGLGWDLSEPIIIDTLQKLEHAGIRVCSLVIDDNWQYISGRNYGASGTWSHFEANEKFPGGLKGLVAKIREKFPYILHIGVWHALHGYWDGLTPGGEIARKYKTVEVAWRDNVNSVDKMLTFVDPVDVERFYDDFYRFLSESGVDCVKTDVQCRIDELKYGKDKAKLARPYQDAFKKSSAKYFDGRVIYCMAHVPQIIYHSLLPDDGRKLAFRTSDDFYPNVPHSHAWHIFSNAMNMMLFSRLNISPDCDMFQSSLPTYASLHAAARCLSGGPIMLTDTPGHHSNSIISAMYSNHQNRLVTTAPSKMALPVHPYLAYRSNKLLYIANVCGNGASILGVFNISDIPLTELIPVSDYDGRFRELVVGRRYLITSYNRKPYQICWVASPALLLTILEPGEWDVFTATRVEKVSWGNEMELDVSVLRLANKITGVAAVKGWCLASTGQLLHTNIKIELFTLGILKIFLSDLHSVSLSSVQVLIDGILLEDRSLQDVPSGVKRITVDMEESILLVDCTGRDVGGEGGDGKLVVHVVEVRFLVEVLGR